MCNIPLLSLEEVQNNKLHITIDYLKSLPENDYIIGPGDTLFIRVSRIYPELDYFGTVDGEGTIYLPKLKRVYVNNLSINELNVLLNEAFKKFVKFPSVEVSISSYRSIKVFVKGEVEDPGIQVLPVSLSTNSIKATNLVNKQIIDNSIAYRDNNMQEYPNYFPTVFDPIRSSNGITQFSYLSNIQIIRRGKISNNTGKLTTFLNFEDVLLEGDTSQNIRIYDGDVMIDRKNEKPNINILTKSILSKLSPNFLQVFITGRVKRPGNIKVSKASVLEDAIEMAGGTKVLKEPVTFIRFNIDGTIDKRKFKYNRRNKRGSFENPLLRNGDLIIVGNNTLVDSNEIISELTNPFIGIFSVYGLIKGISI